MVLVVACSYCRGSIDMKLIADFNWVIRICHETERRHGLHLDEMTAALPVLQKQRLVRIMIKVM